MATAVARPALTIEGFYKLILFKSLKNYISMSIVTLNLHSFVEIEKQAQDIIDKKAGNKPTEDTELVSLS